MGADAVISLVLHVLVLIAFIVALTFMIFLGLLTALDSEHRIPGPGDYYRGGR